MDKKTFEELKSMTTEDLIRHAMMLQESLEEKEKDNKDFYDRWVYTCNKLTYLRDAIKSVANLIS